MWRSIATRTSHVIRRASAINYSEVKSTSCNQIPTNVYRPLRFLSYASNNQNVETQFDPFTSANEDSPIFDLSSEDFGEIPFDGFEDNLTSHDSIDEALPVSYPDSVNCDSIDETVTVSDPNSVNCDVNGDMHVEEEALVYEIDVDKLESVLSLLQSSVDGSLESTLNGLDLYLHEKFVIKVLETPLLLGENLLRFFKWAMTKHEFKVTQYVVSLLVDAICSEHRKKNAYVLWDLVNEMSEKDTCEINVAILNKMIAVFSILGKGKAALSVFNKLDDFGCVANEETYYFTIEALCRRSFFDWGLSVCEKMLDAKALPDTERVSKMITWFCKGGNVKIAHSLYQLAKEKNKLPSRSCIHFLISSLSQKDETVNLALEMLDDICGETRKYAIKPFSAVIHGLCRMKDFDKAKAVLDKMITEGGPPPGNVVFNSIITGYSKSGDMKEAMEMLALMEKRNLKPDVYTYTVVISGYCNGGQMEDALKVLSEAKKKHKKLSVATYHSLIRGYCKLQEFDNAINLFNEMKDFGVKQNVDEYNKLIQSLCLNGLDWRSAEKLLEEMKEKGIFLNGITKGLIVAVKELEQEAMAQVTEQGLIVDG